MKTLPSFVFLPLPARIDVKGKLNEKKKSLKLFKKESEN